MESHFCSQPTGARCFSPFRSSRSGRTRPVGARFSFSGVARERVSERANLKKPVVTVIGVYFDKVDIQIHRTLQECHALLPRAISHCHLFESILSYRRARVGDIGKQDDFGNTCFLLHLSFSSFPRVSLILFIVPRNPTFSAFNYSEALRDRRDFSHVIFPITRGTFFS